MPVSWAQTGLPPRNFCFRPIFVYSKTKKQSSQKTASTAILKPMLSSGRTSSDGMLIPPSAPPLAVMICAEMAESTLIMATVVTNTGMWNTEASTELSSEHPTAAPKITRIMSARLPVAL